MLCKKRSLKRGTFLRWRKRLTVSANDQGFVEVPGITLPYMPLGRNQGLEVQISHDIWITVLPDCDLELVGRFIAVDSSGGADLESPHTS